MTNQTGAFPARILDRALSVERLTGVELPDGVDAFVFPAEISSDRLDFFFTHMAESSLRNYATATASGVSLLDSHNSRNLGFGQSLAGVFEVEGDVSRVVSDFYTIPGIRFGGGLTYESTDDFIKAVKARLIRDISIGWYGGEMICDICGNSFSDWGNCSHWPGEKYAVGDKGEKTVVATFAVEDAHLAEVSVVYDGATPGAMIMRATEMAEAGKLSPEMTRKLEVKYRIKLPGAGRQTWPGVEINGKGKLIMTEPIQVETTDNGEAIYSFAEMDQVRAILTEAKAPEGIEQGVRWLTTEVTRLTAEVQRLQPLADDGKQYRADLISDTLAEGVRAMGDTFPEETYRGMLENGTSIEAIKKMRDAFAEQAKQQLPAGRQTVDDDQLQNPQRTEPATPNLAYAAA